MKKLLKILIVMLISLVCLTSCNVNEEASIKVKFVDSQDEEKSYFYGVYDITNVIEIGLDEFVPTKEGYKFVSWTLDINGETAFDPAAYSGTDAQLKVYAQWEELRKITTYSGANKLGTYYYDDLVQNKKEITDASKDGYKFIGWTTDSLNENDFNLESYVYPNNTKNVNIYANFEIITTLSLYNGNSVSYQLNLDDVKSETVSLPTPTKEGYTFKGWYLDSEFKTEFDYKNYTASSANVSLYAKFEAKPMVYYYDGETQLYKFYLENKDDVTVNNPTKEGYTFIKWVDKDGEDFILNTNATKDQTAYASYEQRVVVNFYDGNTVAATRYLDELTAETIPAITKDTYLFKGWFTDSSFTTEFSLNGYTTSQKVVSLYAKLLRDSTIIFMNGGELVAERKLAELKDGTKTVPTVTKSGYYFINWSTDEAGENVFAYSQFTTDELRVYVYANYTEKLKVQYMVDGNIYDSKFLDEIENTYMPTTPTKEGYFFKGWVDDDDQAFTLNKDSETNLNAFATWYSNPKVENLSYNVSGSTISVTWTKANDTSYKVYIDNELVTTTTLDSYTVDSNLTVGKHTAKVIAVFMEHESNEATIDYIQKINFTLSNVEFDKDTRKVSWTNDSNATSYKVIIKDNNNEEVLSTEVSSNECTIPSDVLSGNYNITVEAYAVIDELVIGSFERKTDNFTVLSIVRYTESGLCINENDEYVLFAGNSVSFGNYEFVESDYYTLSNDNKTITPKAEYIGTSFVLTTTTSKTIKAYIAGLVSSISSGSNYSYYKNASSLNNKNNSETNRTGFIVTNNYYEVGTADNDFILDIDINGSGTKATDYEFNLTIKVDGNESANCLKLTKSSDGTYHIEWLKDDNDRLIVTNNSIVEITLKPKYLHSTQLNNAPTYSFTFKVNNGANAYGYLDLRTKVANLNYTTINMHQNVTITKELIYQVLGSNFGKDESTNNHNYAFIRRQSNGYEEFTLNGNYFKIDASSVPLSKSQPHTVGTTYSVYWPFVSVICIENSGNTVGTFTNENISYQVKDNAKSTIKNLEIKGNTTFTLSVEAATNSEKLKAEILTQSGGFDGIITCGYSDLIYNCVVHHVNEGTKFETVNNDNASGAHVYTLNNSHILDSCSYGDNWANNTYFWSDGYLEYKNSYIYDAGGVATFVANSNSTTLEETDAILYQGTGTYAYTNLGENTNSVTKDILISNFPTIVFNNTTVDNWQYGSEAFYTIYAISGAIAGYKTQMEGMISGFTNEEYTLLQEEEGTSYTKINMALQIDATDGQAKVLKSYDLVYVYADGTRATQNVRTVYSGDTGLPNHALAQSSPYTVLFPLSTYSTSAAVTTAIGEISAELTAYGTYAAGYAEFNASSLSHLIDAYGEDYIRNKSLSIPQDASGQQTLVTQVLYLNAFNDAYENKNGSFFVEVTLHSLTGSNGLSTIIVEGMKSSD